MAEKEYIEKSQIIRHLTGKSIAKYPTTFVMGLCAAADEIRCFPAADVVAVVQYQEAIEALDEALIMDNRNSFDDENFPCGHRQWCGLCDENEEHGCAHAYMEWLRGHGERRGDDV